MVYIQRAVSDTGPAEPGGPMAVAKPRSGRNAAGEVRNRPWRTLLLIDATRPHAFSGAAETGRYLSDG